MSQTFDTIVIGVGGMGSATCYELARRGQKVLGIERYNIGHAMGSSHGETRMLRLAYFEGLSYVPMVLRAHGLWREIGDRIGDTLLHITGTLDIAKEGDGTVENAKLACEKFNLVYEGFTANEIASRFPGFKTPSTHIGILQPDGGFVMSEKAILAYTALAIDKGAEIHPRERVLSFEPTASGGVRVKTDLATYEAASLVVSPGPWIAKFVPALASVTQAYRQIFGWFRPLEPDLFRMGSFPSFTLRLDEGHYYGFPLHNNPGLKLGGPHHGREKCDPDTLIRESRPSDEEGLRICLERYLPRAMGPALSVRTCIYTMTPDEDFIIDRLADAPQIVIASPCSGHGFKFASVMGEILADLAMNKEPAFDLSPFKMSRFQ